jgi:hypothetical protein
MSDRLGSALYFLFGDRPCHLDHDPPLRVRKFNKRTGRYTPDANDPDYLVYRTAEDHRLKTNVRGDGAQFPDRVLIKRAKRLERKKKRKKTLWPKRKLRSRSSWPPKRQHHYSAPRRSRC